MGEMHVLGCYHPDAEMVYNACMDMRRVLLELQDPRERVKRRVGGESVVRVVLCLGCGRYLCRWGCRTPGRGSSGGWVGSSYGTLVTTQALLHSPALRLLWSALFAPLFQDV